MDTLRLSIAPDVSPDCLPGWYIFATWLQRQLGCKVLPKDYESFLAQRQAAQSNEIELIYANPFDAAYLMRDHHFAPIARPEDIAAEVTLITRVDHHTLQLEHLQAGIKVAVSDNPDVQMLGLILLEPADLRSADVQLTVQKNHLMAVKALLQKQVDVAFVPSHMFNNLSQTVRSQLHVLVSSQRQDIEAMHHVFLVAPSQLQHVERLRQLFAQMMDDTKTRSILADMGVPGWYILSSQEEIDFMIDLVDALQA